MEIRIEELKPMKIAYVRHTGPYSQCGKAWNTLMNWAMHKGLIGPKTIMVGVSHDRPDNANPEDLRYDAGIVLEKEIETESYVKTAEIGGGEYAKYTHVGDFTLIGESFMKMITVSIPSAGKKIRSSPCLEIYLDNPDNIPEEKYRTELCVPVE